jgi:hypothetical protein
MSGILDHLAESVGETAKALREVADSLHRVGLPEDAKLVRQHATRLARLSHDFLTATQPIEIPKEKFKARLNNLIASLQEVAGDLITARRHDVAVSVSAASRSLIGAAAHLDD